MYGEVKVTTKLTVEAIRDLVGRAERKDPAAIAEMRKEGVLEALAAEASPTNHLLTACVDRYAGQNLLLREGAIREVEAVRSGLSLPGDGAAERLLVDAVATAWLLARTLDAEAVVAKGQHPAVAAAAAKLAAVAEKRMAVSLKALEQVRRLVGREPAVVPSEVVRPRLMAANKGG